MWHLIFIFFFTISTGQEQLANPLPEWVHEYWTQKTNGKGIWIADNSVYKSEQEPYEAYGLEWTYKLAQKYVFGRLYCIQDGKDIGTIWEFMEYWDVAEGKLKAIQIGSDGSVGQGEIWQTENGEIKSQITITNPDGGSRGSGHIMAIKGSSQISQAYRIVGDQWEKARKYVWEWKK